MKPELSDRERILMTIVSRLSSTQTLGPGRAWGSEAFKDNVHFAPWDKPQKGDLVLASSGGIGRWKVCFYVEYKGNGNHLVREIGTDLLCDYGNEEFHPIKGLGYIDLLVGAEYEFYVKVRRAFGKGDEYMYRFGGIKFDGDSARITIREAFGGLGKDSQPFDCNMQWTKRTSVKAILAAMREAGYGAKSFRPEPTLASEPASGLTK